MVLTLIKFLIDTVFVLNPECSRIHGIGMEITWFVDPINLVVKITNRCMGHTNKAELT